MRPRAAKPVVPWAVHTATVSSAADAAAVPGLAREFFAPVMVITRVTIGAAATPGGGDATTDPDRPASASNAAAGSAGDGGAGRPELTAAFLRAVPQLLEEGVWGNLVACVYAPRLVEEAAGPALQTCIDDLRYGTVLLNMPSYYGYSMPEGGWGGFQYPDTSVSKPGSGVGHIGHAYEIDGMEKQVIMRPWGMKLPPMRMSLPRFAVKGLVGLLSGGLRGVLQAASP